MLAIFKRDFKSYFHSFIGWLFIGVLWFFISLYVAAYNFLGLRTTIVNSLSMGSIVLLLLIPVLTMRVFAEERRQKTDQLLFTAPVSIGSVVFGKFMAVAAVFSIPIAAVCLYPLLFSLFGTIPFGSNYTAILGLWLFGLASIAIAEFASSLTENPIISAVISFGLLLASFLMSNITSMISSSGNWLTKILDCFDTTARFDTFLNDQLDITAVVYLVSVIALFLFLTSQAIQKRRYSISKKTLSFGAYSTSLIAVAVVITVVVNLAVNALPESYKTIDVSQNKLYTLTDDTKTLVKALDEDITIYVLASEKSQDELVKNTLAQYESLSSHITVSTVDPAVNPEFINKYSDNASTLYQNSLVVESAERSKVINYSDLYESSLNYSTYSYETTGYDGEGQITSAIAYVTTDDMPKVYMITGHGESSLDEDFLNALKKQNIETADLNLLTEDAVPEDAQAVVINAPSSDFSADDAKKVTDYLENGGNAVIITNFQATDDMTNFNTILDFYGVSAKAGIVIDNNRNNFYSNGYYLLPTVSSDDDATSGVLSGNGYVFAPYAQALSYDEENTGISFTALLTTSDSAYIHADVTTPNQTLEQTDQDEAGSFVIGLKAQRTDGSSTAYIYGCSQLFTDNADQMVSGSNLSLFTGTFGNMVEATSSVSIPVKSYSSSSMTISSMKQITLSILCVIVIPVVILLVGFITWLMRRKK